MINESEKEYMREYKKKWLLENPNYMKNYREKNKDKIKAKRNSTLKASIPSYLLRQAKRRARDKGLPCDITKEDIIIPEKCPVLGIDIKSSIGKGKAEDGTPSIDRIDNALGYTKQNIIVVSWRANRLKGSLTFDEIKRLYDFYVFDRHFD
jgi:hypothetical protein